MRFKETFDPIEGPIKGQYTTEFFIELLTKDIGQINGFRIINSKPYNLTIEFDNSKETFEGVLTKVDRLTRIDNEMFITMCEVIKRTKNSEDSLETEK